MTARSPSLLVARIESSPEVPKIWATPAEEAARLRFTVDVVVTLLVSVTLKPNESVKSPKITLGAA